uniref:Nucleolar protein 16 n=1 Tax=Steinernema glaseri TaxID=37863 RepID=A0A1I7YLD0_9BILA
MPRSVRHGGKKTPVYRDLKNYRSKKLKALKKKKEAKTTCKAVSEAWDKSSTMKKNLESMGLTYNVNNLIGLPKTNIVTGNTEDVEMMSLEEAKKQSTKVVSQLEGEKKKQMKAVSKRPEFKRLLPRDVEFCNKMIEAHGLDFEAMARDPLNLNQLTAKQIERRINTFKRSFRFTEAAE